MLQSWVTRTGGQGRGRCIGQRGSHRCSTSRPVSAATDGSAARAALRRALIDLGIGLWLTEPAAKAYASGLKERGKPVGIVICALTHRATRIAHALVRDHTTYDPTKWA